MYSLSPELWVFCHQWGFTRSQVFQLLICIDIAPCIKLPLYSQSAESLFQDFKCGIVFALQY